MLRLTRIPGTVCSSRGPLGALALMTAMAAAIGCSDDSEPVGGGGSTSLDTSSSSASSGGFGGQGGSGGSGGGYTCLPTEGTTLALTEINFGPGNSGQWKAIGLNIDNLVSDGNSTDVCQLNAGGSSDTAYPDGNDGIDNSFGKNLLPVILGLAPTWPTGVNNYLTDGAFNAMMKMYCLPPTGDVPQLTTKVFGGTALVLPPKYDGTDLWPVTPEILSDPEDPESSTLIFENSSVTGSKFDSGKNETFILTFPIEFNNQLTLLKLTLHSAQLIVTLSDDRKSATGGVIGGVLDTEEFIDQVKKLAFIADVCNETMYQDILDYVRQASDIMNDGTQDPSQTCNGISFGVAFEMKEVQIGGVGPAAPDVMACP